MPRLRDTTLSDALIDRLQQLYPNTRKRAAMRAGLSDATVVAWMEGRSCPEVGDPKAVHLAALVRVREAFRRK